MVIAKVEQIIGILQCVYAYTLTSHSCPLFSKQYTKLAIKTTQVTAAWYTKD